MKRKLMYEEDYIDELHREIRIVSIAGLLMVALVIICLIIFL